MHRPQQFLGADGRETARAPASPIGTGAPPWPPPAKSTATSCLDALRRKIWRWLCRSLPSRNSASLVANGIGGHREVEVGLIGREGVTGTPLLHGSDRSPHTTYTQAAGAAHCMSAANFRAIAAENSAFRSL